MRGLFLTTISLFLFGFSYPRTAEGANFLQIGYLNDGGSGFSCGDTDHDGLNEIYFQSSKDGFWRIYEHIGSNIYFVVYEFDNSTVPDRCPWVIGDLDGDSLSDVAGWWGLLVAVYESAAIDSYATNTVWKSNDTVDNWDTYITDLDQDGKKEILCATRVKDHIYLYECTGDNTYELVYQDKPPEDGYYGGIAYGDFDKDGKMEMVMGQGNAPGATDTSYAHIFVYENTAVGVDSYAMTYIDTVWTDNAYELTSSADMDGDGWPEFVVGGRHSYITDPYWDDVVTIFEADSDNFYSAKWYCLFETNLRSIGPPWAEVGGAWEVNCGDVDGDSVDEFVIATAESLHIYKVFGNDNYQRIWTTLTGPGEYKYRLNDAVLGIYDLNKNGYAEIVVSGGYYDKETGAGPWYETRIYEYVPTGVAEQQNAEYRVRNAECRLMQNYPNPVVSTTEIRYQLPTSGSVTLSIYNLIGQTIKTLVNENQPAGSHSVTWDRKDNSGREVPAGVYFYRLNVGNSGETKRMVVVR